MGLKEDIELYREPATRMVGLTQHPPDHSTDNGLLFSATYLNMLSLNVTTVTWDQEIVWFMQLVDKCQIEPGLIARYPGDKGVQAHDDMIGVASISSAHAKNILAYGRAHRYSWNTAEPGKWSLRTCFYRMGGFVPFLKARAGEKLSWLDHLNVALAYRLNEREASNETSGRCLLFLMSTALHDQGGLAAWAVEHWKNRMNGVYPYGVREMYGIYFGVVHPLSLAAPKTF